MNAGDKDVHARHAFSVGVDDVTDDKRREIFDAIAILDGRRDRRGNHCMCMERMIASLHEFLMQSPDLFALMFGLGKGDADRGDWNLKRFLAWHRRTKARRAALAREGRLSVGGGMVRREMR